jgi:hypothetical protein
MDTNHGAAGDPPDDDVFGPVEDGEEVFEWIDDQDGAQDPAEMVKPPPPTLRERLAAIRSGGRRLRRSRREIAAGAAAIVLACAVGGACTAWFDHVAEASDRGDVVQLAVNSVVNGDPAASSYDPGTTSAVGQYILEVANNSPDAVTLASVDIDAGTLMTSTAWKPVGPSARRIPGGATAKVALTVKLFCPMVTLGQRTGMFSAAPGIGGGSSLPFPAVHTQVRDANGDLHDMVLPTRIITSAQLANGQLNFRSPDGLAIPEIVSADAGACSQYVAATDSQRNFAATAGRYPGTITIGYDKVLSSGSGSFVLGFTVKNTGPQTETLTAHPNGAAAANDDRLRTEWLPTSVELGPGVSAQIQMTVHIHDCTSALTGAPVLDQTTLVAQNGAGGVPEPVFVDQVLTRSLRLAADMIQQEKAACG